MLNPKFKTGDTVKLNSGSPIMTVKEVSCIGYCQCIWFDKKEKLTHEFHEDMLQMVVEAENWITRRKKEKQNEKR